MNPAPSEGRAHTYRRSLGTRVLSSGGALLFGGAAVYNAWTAGYGAALLVTGTLAVLALANLVTAWGDRFTLDEEGVEYRNILLAALGVRPRHVAWKDVAHVREHHRSPRAEHHTPPRAIFLSPRSGRRIVLDSLERFDEILRTVRRRCSDRPPEH